MFKSNSSWQNESTAPENKEVLVLLELKKQNRICYAFARKVSGFWFIKKNLEDINIPCLSDYEILKWAYLPEMPFATKF